MALLPPDRTELAYPDARSIQLNKNLAMGTSETPGKMYALAAILSVLAIIAVILRFYARRLLKSASIEIDDYMILTALVCHTLVSY